MTHVSNAAVAELQHLKTRGYGHGDAGVPTETALKRIPFHACKLGKVPKPPVNSAWNGNSPWKHTGLSIYYIHTYALHICLSLAGSNRISNALSLRLLQAHRFPDPPLSYWDLGRLEMSWMLNACVTLITWDEMHKITVTIYVTVIESAKSHPDTGVSARSPWRKTKSLDSGPTFLLHVLSSVAISCHVWQCVSGTIFGKMLLNRNGHNRTQHDPTGHNTWGPAQDHLPKSNNSGPPDVRDGIAIQDQLLVIRMCPSTYNI